MTEPIESSETMTVLACDRVVLPDGVVEQARIVISDGRIVSISADANLPDPDGWGPPVQRVMGTVLPGYVDTHVHGGGGADFATTDPDEARRAIAFHRDHGTTTTFASLVTADHATLLAQLRTLAPLCDTGELAGLHLEGPYLSLAKCGAHDPALLRSPTPGEVEELIEAGAGHLSMITMAPELPGAPAAIDRFVAAGVTVAVGHTDSSREECARGLGGGARVATHLFNAMPALHHRTPGPVPLLLTDPGVMVELICDGVHVHPDMLALAVRTAGPGRTALITDAMAATGMTDGHYRIGTLDVSVEGGVARLVGPDGTPGSIAGSTLTMAAALAYVVEVVGVDLVDAARMAATTPATWHGLDGRGVLAPGARADLIVLGADHVVRAVMRSGRWHRAPTTAVRPDLEPNQELR